MAAKKASLAIIIIIIFVSTYSTAAHTANKTLENKKNNLCRVVANLISGVK
jgi:hypothetical protein